ncbi:MAG: hypothetical protein AMS24_00770 [Chlamydiae bacterium SM23_39]|nr:MAG: hypothetical protein AMS24_00770 [Chlamydiae bacterium SM23_39]
MIFDIFKKQGNKYKNFTVSNFVFIDEIKSTLIELTHKCGSKIIHITNKDIENLFSISFKTLPSSSNGVFHILEHMILSGSEKFPIKDPFFSMSRRSLNTFMNALTGNDFTCFPASSEIEKDFYNLLEVYLDAIFHPQLKKESFFREGYRLEFLKPKDSSSELKYQGVVLNEMKGVCSSLDDKLFHAMMEKLTPDLPYAYNVGGDPKKIISLTYEELLSSYKRFYHPSKALFYFYGNINTEKHLDFLEKNVFKNIKNKPAAEIIIKPQKRFDKPVEHTSFYPATEKDVKNEVVAFGFLTTNISCQKCVLSISLLDSILLETDASPLKFNLLNSKLCTQVESFLDLEMSEIPWIIICKGAKKENRDKLFKIIINTLKNIQISKELQEAAFHKLEFSKTEITRSFGPFGLSLFMRAALLKQHGCPTENGLKVHSLFQDLRKDLKNSKFLEDLINQYLIQNKHLVKLTMLPDINLGEKEKEEENKNLQNIKRHLSEIEKNSIVKNYEVIHKKVENNRECLPEIEIDDIPKKSKFYLLEKEDNIFYHNCFTNQIIYVDIIFDLNRVSIDDLPYLSLFSSLISEVGCGKRNYLETLQYINSYIGAVSSYILLNPKVEDKNRCSPTIAIKGKALNRNAQFLFLLLKDIVTSANFKNEERIKELILQYYTALTHNINQNAINYAISHSLKDYSVPLYIENSLYGIPFFKKIENIYKNLEKEIPILINKLEEFKKIFSSYRIVITCSKDFYKKIKKKNFYGINELSFPKKTIKEFSFPLKKDLSAEGKIISSYVSFNALSFETVNYTNPSSPFLLLASSLFENKILHEKIREKGGAYGVFAFYNPLHGTFVFASYRDPNIANTLETFKYSVQEISNKNFTKNDLDEAKRKIIQKLDKPLSPGKKGICAFYQKKSNLTKPIIEKFRKSILNATMDDIQEAVNKNLMKNIDRSKIVSFANKELFQKEIKKLSYSLNIQNI